MEKYCMKKYLLLAMIFTLFTSVAQEPTLIISDYIEQAWSEKIKIIQPKELKERLKPVQKTEEPAESEENSIVGYRVQVFSDNNQRTAKKQAQVRKDNISARFPEMDVYLIYKSPLWRVRVGDFKTRGEAEQVMLEIKKEFPAYASEITVVVDKINLPDK